MKTVIAKLDSTMEFVDVNMPKINEYQALVKIIANGMCGTDVKVIHHSFKGLLEDQYPVALGHEAVGKIVEIGSKVTSFKVGDKVMLPYLYKDVENNPGIGSGWGGNSEYGVVWDKVAPNAPDDAWAMTVLPDDIDPVDATMIVTFREVCSTIKFFGIKPGESVVVMGCGPVGLTYIKIMSLMGIKDIIVCDIIGNKLQQGLDSGAKIALNPAECDLPMEIRKYFPEGVDYVLDAAGSIKIPTQSMPLIKDRGKVLCYGVPAEQVVTIDFSRADYNWSVVYQQMPRKREEGAANDEVIGWIREGKLNPKDFISDYFTFEQSIEAYQKLLDRKLMKKGVIIIDKEYYK